MKRTGILLAAIAMTAVTTPSFAGSWDKPEVGEAITIREACARRVRAEKEHKHLRFKSLPGPYGVFRINAEKLVEYWTQYCPDNAKKVYLAEKK